MEILYVALESHVVKYCRVVKLVPN
jgi:hypothetical protein